MRWSAFIVFILPVTCLIKIRDPRGPHGVLTPAFHSQCPSACHCESGDVNNGGAVTTHGRCHHTCSKSFNGTRYCGYTSEYKGGDAIDCSMCANPEHFGASYRLYSPSKGKPTASMIFLGPWNASGGFGYHWFVEGSEDMDPRVREQFRVLDVVGRAMDGVPHAWFGYQSWFDEDPKVYELDLAVAYVHRLIESEARVVKDYKKITLVGFSQGANLVLEAAMKFPHTLGLVISERGLLLPQTRKNPAAVLTPGAKKTPFLLTSGGADHYYTPELLKECCRALRSSQAHCLLDTVSGLDHYRWSYREWDLALKALGAFIDGQSIDSVSTWTDCGADAKGHNLPKM